MYGVDKLYIPQTLEEALQILDRDPEVMPLGAPEHGALRDFRIIEYSRTPGAERLA